MNRLVKAGRAAQILGVTPQTLRRWEKKGTFLPDRKTKGGTRYYDLDRLVGSAKQESNLSIAYARVSSHDQKKDLQVQKETLATF